MRTPGKKKTIKRTDVRSLKIQPDIKFNRWSKTTVPVIRLSGVWLQNLGFTPAQRVTVTTKNKLNLDQIADMSNGSGDIGRLFRIYIC